MGMHLKVYNTNDGCDVNNKLIIFNNYKVLESWGCPSKVTPHSSVAISLCCRKEVAEDKGSKHILLIKIQPGSEESQTCIDELFGSVISGDSLSKETRNPKLMCANSMSLLWREKGMKSN